MAIKVQTNFFPQLNKPKVYLVYILNDGYISWEFCMRVMKDIFYMNEKRALAITKEILTNGEGLCGAYLFEIAQSKAEIVESLAKEENFSMQCLVEEV
ncbi:MAG: ATP-dependent Clp protease adaptor ClpS [Campylobacterota bacterium]|nr:ATP-dependent Clp protease adaptor ClpS [Campylobacterota bacterium]